MKKFVNRANVEGLLYEHKLETKVTGPDSKNPGTEYIRGSISIATDDACTNVVQINFTYVVPTFGSGKPNSSYPVLKAILAGEIGSIMEHGKDKAGMIKCSTAIDLNEWYDSKNNNELVSHKQLSGGFVSRVNELAPEEQRATFATDIMIVKCTRKEADEERRIPEKVIIKGSVFGYGNILLPVEFSVSSPAGMDYFESLNASSKEPVFTEVRGQLVSSTTVRDIVEENAFGAPTVRQVKSSYKDYLVTWARPEIYLWDDESTLLATEVDEMISNREIHLADMKKRTDEYQAKKKAPGAFTPAASGGYNF